MNSLNDFIKTQASPPVVVPFNVLNIDNVDNMTDFMVSAELDLQMLSGALEEAETMEAKANSTIEALAAMKESGEFGEAAMTLTRFDVAMENYVAFKTDYEVASFETIAADPSAEVELGMEGIGESAKKFAAAVSAIIKQMYETVKAWLKQTFTFEGRLEKNIKVLEELAKEAKGTPKEAKIKPGAINFLQAEGELVVPANAFSEYKLMNASTKSIVGMLGDATKIIEKGEADASQEDINKVITVFDKILAEMGSRGKRPSDADLKVLGYGDKYDNVFATSVLPGNQIIIMSTLKPGKILGMPGIKLVNDKRIKTDALKEVDALDAGGIDARITAAKSSLDHVKALGKDAETLMKAMDTYSKASNKLAKEEGVGVARRAFAGWCVRVVSKYLRNGNLGMAKNAMQFANANAMYAKAGIKNLAEAPAKK